MVSKSHRKECTNMARTKDETIREITTEYLENIDVDNPPTEQTIEVDILEALATEITYSL